MDHDNKTIYDFDLNLICEFFSNMERQGPGSPDVTLKALSFIDNLIAGQRIISHQRLKPKQFFLINMQAIKPLKN